MPTQEFDEKCRAEVSFRGRDFCQFAARPRTRVTCPEKFLAEAKLRLFFAVPRTWTTLTLALEIVRKSSRGKVLVSPLTPRRHWHKVSRNPAAEIPNFSEANLFGSLLLFREG